MWSTCEATLVVRRGRREPTMSGSRGGKRRAAGVRARGACVRARTRVCTRGRAMRAHGENWRAALTSGSVGGGVALCWRWRLGCSLVFELRTACVGCTWCGQARQFVACPDLKRNLDFVIPCKAPPRRQDRARKKKQTRDVVAPRPNGPEL